MLVMGLFHAKITDTHGMLEYQRGEAGRAS